MIIQTCTFQNALNKSFQYQHFHHHQTLHEHHHQHLPIVKSFLGVHHYDPSDNHDDPAQEVLKFVTWSIFSSTLFKALPGHTGCQKSDDARLD